MAAYTTPTEVREALAATGDTAGTAAALSDDDIQAEIDDVTAEIDGKVAGAPFDPVVPRVVTIVARDIAAYLATLKHRKAQTMAERHPVQLRYDRAVGLLAAMAAGTLDLTDDSEAAGASTGAVVNTLPEEGFWDLADLGLSGNPPRAPFIG